MERMAPHLRIYGDNIIECERALRLIARAFTSNARFIPSLPNVPRYVVQVDQTPLVVELLPGHGRWKVNVQDIIRARGGLLRESADFVVTRCLIDMQREDILFAGEFCSALPH